MKKDKLLPIGSIIRIESSDLMICAYFDKKKELDGKIYDYVCCPYPYGLTKDALLINKEKIQKVVFVGFQDNRFLTFKSIMEESYGA